MSDSAEFLNKAALELYYPIIPSLLEGYRAEGFSKEMCDSAEENAKRLVSILDEFPNDAPNIVGTISVLLGAVIAGSMGDMASSIIVSHMLGRAKGVLDKAIGENLSNLGGK